MFGVPADSPRRPAAALGGFTAFYVTMWWSALTKATPRESALELGTGFVTNFFDTLGIGSFAPTTSIFKFFKVVPDRLIPARSTSATRFRRSPKRSSTRR